MRGQRRRCGHNPRRGHRVQEESPRSRESRRSPHGGSGSPAGGTRLQVSHPSSQPCYHMLLHVITEALNTHAQHKHWSRGDRQQPGCPTQAPRGCVPCSRAPRHNSEGLQLRCFQQLPRVHDGHSEATRDAGAELVTLLLLVLRLVSVTTSVTTSKCYD